MLTRLAAVLSVVGGLLLSGCMHQEYTLVLRPQGDHVERRLEWRTGGTQTTTQAASPPPAGAAGQPPGGAEPGGGNAGGNAHVAPTASAPASAPSLSPGHGDDKVLARLAKAYDQGGHVQDDARVYTARFKGKMPDDIGGAGTYRHFTSELGDLTIYSERFRGDDDLQGQVAAVQGVGDKVTDLLIAWLEREMGRDKRFPKLREFMDKDFRHDLKNVGLMVWRAEGEATHEVEATHGGGGSMQDTVERLMKDTLARVLQYLAERGYIRVDELPAVTRAAARGDAASAMPLVQRWVARRMGVQDRDPIPESLAFLGDADRAWKSLDVYLASTREHQEALAAWEAAVKATKPGETPPQRPEAIEVLSRPIDDFMYSGFALGWDTLSVELECPVAPLATNGQWDATHHRISWPKAALGSEHAPPLYCYAVWMQPAEAFQREHFGSVVLHDENLMAYVLWRNGLSKAEAKEWSAFLAGMKPEGDGAVQPGLRRRLAAFRFSGESVNKGAQGGSAEQPDGMLQELMNALDPDAAKKGK